MVCLGRPYQFKFFKSCLPQVLLGPFLNTLTHMFGTVEFWWQTGKVVLGNQIQFYIAKSVLHY